MGLQTLKQQKGFTIVELLIVIVVIGILAAITIVAFNGVQNRAKATKAQAVASEVQKKAEAMNANNSIYPFNQAAFTGDIGSLSSGVSLGTPDADNGQTTVMYTPCPVGTATAATITGATIRWWDYAAAGTNKTTPTTGGKTITVGTC